MQSERHLSQIDVATAASPALFLNWNDKNACCEARPHRYIGYMRADFEVNTTRELLAYGWQFCVALFLSGTVTKNRTSCRMERHEIWRFLLCVIWQPFYPSPTASKMAVLWFVDVGLGHTGVKWTGVKWEMLTSLVLLSAKGNFLNLCVWGCRIVW